jgi:hypothetical protein
MIADHDTAILALRAAETAVCILGDQWVAWLNWQYLHDDQFRAAMPHQPVQVTRHEQVIFPPPHLVTWPPGATPRLIDMPPILIDLRFGQKSSRRPRRPPDTALPLSLERLMAETTIKDPEIFLAALAGLTTPGPGQTRKRAIRNLAAVLSGDQREQDRIRKLVAAAERRTRKAIAAPEDEAKASADKTGKSAA